MRPACTAAPAGAAPFADGSPATPCGPVGWPDGGRAEHDRGGRAARHVRGVHRGAGGPRRAGVVAADRLHRLGGPRPGLPLPRRRPARPGRPAHPGSRTRGPRRRDVLAGLAAGHRRRGERPQLGAGQREHVPRLRPAARAVRADGGRRRARGRGGRPRRAGGHPGARADRRGPRPHPGDRGHRPPSRPRHGPARRCRALGGRTGHHPHQPRRAARPPGARRVDRRALRPRRHRPHPLTPAERRLLGADADRFPLFG